MIARCTNPNCLYEWQAMQITGTNMQVEMSNNTISCPRCRSLSDVDGGTFVFDAEGKMTILSRLKSLSKKELESLKDIVEKAKTEDYSVEQFQNEIKNLAFDISPFLKGLSDYAAKTAFFSLLLFLIFQIYDGLSHRKKIEAYGLGKPNTEKEKVVKQAEISKTSANLDNSIHIARKLQLKEARKKRKHK